MLGNHVNHKAVQTLMIIIRMVRMKCFEIVIIGGNEMRG